MAKPEKMPPNWEGYRDQDEISLLDAACLLSLIQPFPSGMKRDHKRIDEREYYSAEISSNVRKLRKAGIARTEEKIINPGQAGKFKEDWVTGEVSRIKEEKVETEWVKITDLIKLAESNNLGRVYEGLTGTGSEKNIDSLHSKEKTTVYKLLLGMAIEHYDLDPQTFGQRGKNTRITGTNKNSIWADLESLNLNIRDEETIKTVFENALNHEEQRSSTKRILKDWIDLPE